MVRQLVLENAATISGSKKAAEYCPYCMMAKRLLDKKGVSYTEINMETQPGLIEEVMRRTRPDNASALYWRPSYWRI
jgi:glutaredoxin